MKKLTVMIRVSVSIKYYVDSSGHYCGVALFTGYGFAIVGAVIFFVVLSITVCLVVICCGLSHVNEKRRLQTSLQTANIQPTAVVLSTPGDQSDFPTQQDKI